MPVRYCGVSVQTKATDMPTAREAAKAYVKDLADQLEVALRKHIGDTRPTGAPMFSMDGPVPDPSHSSLSLQGKPEYVYVFTSAVPVELDDLPADCTAYMALKGGH
jgi:hypothetical protein